VTACACDDALLPALTTYSSAALLPAAAWILLAGIEMMIGCGEQEGQ
jgi:hypothetical protein